MRVKFGTGTKDVPIKEVTKENYIVPKGEEGSYHVMQRIPFFNQTTGKDLSNYRIQKYGAKEFRDLAKNLRQQGYVIDVLHDPTEFLRKQAEEAEERKNLTETKRRELEAKRREAEKAALKAEILAELKEQGIIPSGCKKPDNEPKKPANGTASKKK